jgi:hypothetical protein
VTLAVFQAERPAARRGPPARRDDDRVEGQVTVPSPPGWRAASRRSTSLRRRVAEAELPALFGVRPGRSRSSVTWGLSCWNSKA